uniref:Uncharacterized protein n=1 Tax=Romanomermis culicivorax TaxID=13658 RepID=A0A915L5E8_ROMCU
MSFKTKGLDFGEISSILKQKVDDYKLRVPISVRQQLKNEQVPVPLLNGKCDCQFKKQIEQIIINENKGTPTIIMTNDNHGIMTKIKAQLLILYNGVQEK